MEYLRFKIGRSFEHKEVETGFLCPFTGRVVRGTFGDFKRPGLYNSCGECTDEPKYTDKEA